MTIRLMGEADLPQVFDICDRVNEQMRFHELGYPYSHNAMCRAWPKVINDKNHIALCSDNGGEIDGVFLARLQDNSYFLENYLVAYEIAIHADPKLQPFKMAKVTLKIREEAEKVMKTKGVNTFFMSTHPQQAGSMDHNFQKNGYRCVGYYYIKEL